MKVNDYLGAEAITGGPTTFQAWQHSCNAELANQKALYDFALLSANARFNDRQTINGEMFGLYKSQIDADFGLYKNQRDQFDVLADRIGKLETAAAVNAAVEPWRSKVTKMEIASVAGMVGLEAERRMCADKDGMVDVNGILSEMIDNVINTKPFKVNSGFLGELEIGSGKIKMNLPLVNRALVLSHQDLIELKDMLNE